MSNKPAALLDSSGRQIPPSTIAGIRAGAEKSAMFDSQHRSTGGAGVDLDGWNPPLQSADSAALRERDITAARVRDLVANEGWAQAALDRKMDQLIGAGWRFSSRVDWRTLGLDRETVKPTCLQITAAFKAWGGDTLKRCDFERDLKWGGLLGVAVREFVTLGETLVAMRWRDSPLQNWKWRTAIQVIDVDRLSNPNGQADSDTLRGGIELDGAGAATHYNIRNGHPGDFMMGASHDLFTWTRETRDTPTGRPRIIHLKNKNRPEQHRAVSAFVAGLNKAKMLSRFSDAELQNATVNALFAAVIYSNLDRAMLGEQLGLEDLQGLYADRNKFYDASSPRLGGAKVGHLFPGDKLDLNASPRQTTAFSDYQAAFLQAFAASLGLTYEEVSMDFSKTNYSSARAAMVVTARSMYAAKARITEGLSEMVLLCVIEEAIDNGTVELPRGAPGLYEAPAAWLAGKWIGPPRGWVDPVKEVQAAVARVTAGLSTFEDEAALQGLVYEEVLDQLAIEAEDFKSRGLIPPSLAEMLNAMPSPATDNALSPQ